MNKILQFDFIVEKENRRIKVSKEFDAPLEMVWKAWTTAEILDQWWAPLPFKNETISMNFSNGGMWHYAMISPQKERYYTKASYQDIEHLHTFSYKDGFCDEKGENLNELPSIHWNHIFSNSNSNTLVSMDLNFATLEDLEAIIQMGFKEGFTMGLNQLEKLLPKLNKL